MGAMSSNSLESSINKKLSKIELFLLYPAIKAIGWGKKAFKL